MVTNTYLPHVGGVAKSVSQFTEAYRKLGHRVLVLCPEFPDSLDEELDVVRIPAIQNFNGSDFSVRLPVPAWIYEKLNSFKPDIVHSHHSFLLGDTALRIAAKCDVPLIFTHHTMYERYTHYVPGDSPELQDFVIGLTTEYANLASRVIAPSESIKQIIEERGIETDIDVIPTGVELERLQDGNGKGFRERFSIPEDAFVVGHLGRLAPEKNLEFLAEAVSRFIQRNPSSYFLLVGNGSSMESIEELFSNKGLRDRLITPGALVGQEVADSYQAMDMFVFASKTETQGMVLTEAMAAGLAVVALDAPGAREVVENNKNGQLLFSEDEEEFSQAIEKVQTLILKKDKDLIENVKKTAEEFSIENTAKRALDSYKETIRLYNSPFFASNGEWESLLQSIQAEFELRATHIFAFGSALSTSRLVNRLGLRLLADKFRNFQQRLSRSEWTVRLLKLWKSATTADSPGLILIQIDGLSKAEFESALSRGKMPFLRHLLKKEEYALNSLYSGIPSTTPAVQGELFYGKKMAVPAFSFMDKDRKQVTRMLNPETAYQVESELKENGVSLLSGGSSYGNIYTGGSLEPHFSCASVGWGTLLEVVNPWSVIGVIIWHGVSIVRSLVFMVLEFFLALFDSVQGVYSGKDILRELSFIPSRVAVSILLRDMCTAGAVIDSFRGLPVIHLNYLGYDEQAHRRGPSSRFAHWSLKGIDYSIKRIWKAARRSSRREYQIWIYSDHGQETTVSYEELYGRSIQTAVNEVFHGRSFKLNSEADSSSESEQLTRASWIGGRLLQFFLRKPKREPNLIVTEKPVVAASGPLGHINLKAPISQEEKHLYAKQLVRDAKVPLVIFTDSDQAACYTEKGQFLLPEDSEEILGTDHPYKEIAARELVALAAHPLSGDFVISGWRLDDLPLSFPKEGGAHAGPGPFETQAFFLAPKRITIEDSEGLGYRPLDIRNAALKRLRVNEELDTLAEEEAETTLKVSAPDKNEFRVMTYNVHSCIGTDGKLSHSRIAKLIACYEPDIIALQELDAHRARTGHLHQVEELASELQMNFHFHPAIKYEDELYGDAILTPHPIKLIKAGELASYNNSEKVEPRGALWAEITLGGKVLQCFNTHLGLERKHRQAQARDLQSENWISDPRRRGPTIVCGDFNMTPRSEIYKQFSKGFVDSHLHAASKKPENTWHSRIPLSRIDYVFSNEEVKIIDAFVPQTSDAKIASDHLPLVVDFSL